MLAEFEDTQSGLIVNRLKGGDIGALCHRAVASHGRPNARFLLQGRKGTIGLWQPGQLPWQLNAHESRLLG